MPVMFTVLQYKSDVEYLHSRLGKNILETIEILHKANPDKIIK